MVLVNSNRHCSRRREVARLIPIIGIICFIIPFGTSATIGNIKNITADILKYRNTDVNPCDNFYQFACGNAKGNPEVSTDFVSVVDKSMDDLIQKQTSSNFKPFKLIEDVYKTCMNDKAVGQQALDLLKKVIEKLGGWPVLTDVKDSNFDWVDFTIESKRTGLTSDAFLDIGPEIYSYFNEGSMKYFIYAVPEVWKNKSSKSLDELSTAYRNYIAKISTLLGNKRDISKEIDEIIEFEQKILEVRWGKHSGNGSNEITIEELIKKWPSINWNKLINNVIINNLETPIKITELSLWETASLPNFIELFEKTPKHVLANYAVWKIVQNAVPYLTEEYRELKREYCLNQTCEDTTRALSCAGVVKQYLGPAVNLLYAKNYIGSEIVNGIEDIIANLKAVLVDLVNESTWMSQEEKKEDIEIIKNTEFVIGFEERDKSDNEFDEYYKNLDIDTNNYFQTLLNLELFNKNKKFNNVTSLGLQNAINPMKFSFAFSTFGRIYISMGMFREPIFDPKYPMHVNFGRLAPIIAVELSKVIYNAEHKSSEGLISCFRHQYDNYTNFEEVRHYASNAKVSWRVSFHMGFKIAYLAYQRWVKNNGVEPALPGLPYTNNQLFWIDSVRISCMNSSNLPKVIDGKYNIFEFGFYKAVTSTEHFSDAFECPNNETSFMYNYGKSCTYL